MVMPLPESKEAFFARLREAEEGGTLIRFHPQFGSYAVTREPAGWAVRRMEVDAAEAEAYLAKHGIFMPEHAAMIAKPGKAVLEVPTMDALIAALDARWPL
ncbi:MAG: hypothetical protein JJ863_04475 [Deltaproteobacteria bacterium]|nr:hypothetical protein [Deltaproteobacteria bacterium]